MRIIAYLRAVNPLDDKEAIRQIRDAFQEYGLIECDDPIEKRDVIEKLVYDMTESVRERFQRTVHYVAKHAVEETVASIDKLKDGHFLIWMRNVKLNVLLPRGHEMLQYLLRITSVSSNKGLLLLNCEIREHGQDAGFLFAAWTAGETNFLRFIFSGEKIYNICIATLFIIGLMLVIVLTLANITNQFAELGLRLGAPMLVSSSVLMLERWASWLNDRTPRLRWSPFSPSEPKSPLRTDLGFDRGAQ